LRYYKFFKNISCTDSAKCFKEVWGKLEAIGLTTGVKNNEFYAGLSINHDNGEHRIQINIVDDLVEDRKLHTATKAVLKKPAIIPTEIQLKAAF